MLGKRPDVNGKSPVSRQTKLRSLSDRGAHLAGWLLNKSLPSRSELGHIGEAGVQGHQLVATPCTVTRCFGSAPFVPSFFPE